MSRPKKPSRDFEGIMKFLETVPFKWSISDDFVFFEASVDSGFCLSSFLTLDSFILKYGRFARLCQENFYDKTN